MAKAPVMPLWTDALIGDTTHLSAEQFGCYVLILVATWRNNGKPLPDDDSRMAKICKIGVTKWRRKVKPILREFFDVNESGWHQQRLEKEWNRVSRFLSQQAAKGKAGGLAKRNARARIHKPYKESLSSKRESVAARACVPSVGAAHARDDVPRSIGDILGSLTAPSTPAEPRASTHWRYLLERGRPGEADAYFAAIDAKTQKPPPEIFDAVEARMVADGWDEKNQGIAA